MRYEEKVFDLGSVTLLKGWPNPPEYREVEYNFTQAAHLMAEVQIDYEMALSEPVAADVRLVQKLASGVQYHPVSGGSSYAVTVAGERYRQDTFTVAAPILDTFTVEFKLSNPSEKSARCKARIVLGIFYYE